MNMDELNGLLQILAEDHIDSIVDAQYDDMTAEFSAEFEMINYAAASYDNDAIAYGEFV